METKAGKKKRSSSSSGSTCASSDRTSHCPALPAVIEDLRPWGSVKWKDPALGDVRSSLPPRVHAERLTAGVGRLPPTVPAVTARL